MVKGPYLCEWVSVNEHMLTGLPQSRSLRNVFWKESCFCLAVPMKTSQPTHMSSGKLYPSKGQPRVNKSKKHAFGGKKVIEGVYSLKRAKYLCYALKTYHWASFLFLFCFVLFARKSAKDD